MKTVTHFALMSAIVLFAISQNRASEGGKTELEGTWELVSLERDGTEVKPQKDTRASFTGEKFTIQVGDKVIAEGTFKADAKQKPKATDATYSEGPDKGKSFKGIYQIDGDTLKFCRAGSPDQKRPTEFKTNVGSDGVASVYRRLRP
jgi:uncharacterized protein (TIGR03067 family)